MKHLCILFFALFTSLACQSQSSEQKSLPPVDIDFYLEYLGKDIDEVKEPMRTVTPKQAYQMIGSEGDDIFDHTMVDDIWFLTNPEGTIYGYVLSFAYEDFESLWANFKADYGDWEFKNPRETDDCYCWKGVILKMCICIPRDEHSSLAVVVRSNFL